jgi:type IX secretion system PorP/SprF family membrane protein
MTKKLPFVGLARLAATLSLGLGFSVGVLAQDYAPGLTFANPTSLAPSFAGLIEGKVGADFSHRIRRATDSDNFVTTMLTVDLPIDRKFFSGGAGLILASDNAGGLRTNQAHIALSYEVPKPARIRYHHLRAGFQAGILQRTIETSSLVFADQFSALQNRFLTGQSNDILVTNGLTSPVAFDAAVSLLFYRTQKIKGNREFNYYIGGALHHFNKPNISFNSSSATAAELSSRTTIYAGLKYRTRSIVDLNLNGIYTEQNSSQLLTVGAFARVVFYERNVLFSNESASLIAGVNLRMQLNNVRTVTQVGTQLEETTVRRQGLESMVPYIGLEYNRTVSIAVGYDQILASQTALTSSFGGLMFMASYVFGANLYKKPALPFPIF